MKSILLKRMLIGLMVLLSGAAAVQAEDSVSISVSCTIPAIPGVNAPPLAEEDTLKREDKSIAQESAENKADSKSVPTMIQEDAEQDIQLAGNQGGVRLQTIYSR